VIRSISLRSWRNYTELDLSFEKGTTFVTARNGVGKTSLLQGIEWALFGPTSSVPMDHIIQKGRGSASATVEVSLDADRTLRIERSLTGRTQRSVVTVNGVEVAEDQVDGLLTGAFGMAGADVARLAFVPAGSLTDYAKEQFHLRRHLCRLYGIDRMEEAAAELEQVKRAVAADLRKQKDVKAVSAAELDNLRSEAAAAVEAVDAARADAESLRAQLDEARAAVVAHSAVAEFHERAAADAAALSAFARTVADELAEPIDSAPILDVLAARMADVETELDAVRRAVATVDGTRDAVAAAREQLHTAGADCPVCLRPLEAADLATAESRHEAQLQELSDQVARLVDRRQQLEERRRLLQRLSAAAPRIADHGPPPPAPDGDPADAAQLVATLEAAYAAAVEGVGRAASTAEALQRRVREETERLSAQQEAVTLYAKEALVSAAIQTFSESTSQLISEQIDPLAREVARRWKTIFAGRRAGLSLDTDGRLFLERDGHQVPFEAMSAGERAVALITTRLLVLSATSPSLFSCFDEPLEQLDPVNRRTVALFLAQAAGAVGQTLVTTFESGLVRRMAAELDDVHVVQVAADDA
jgi:DNA repair exonuclease SbcCD ATPase subunit